MPIFRRFAFGCLALILGGFIWFHLISYAYPVQLTDFRAEKGIPAITGKIVQFHLNMWRDPQEREKIIARMRGSNAEWDFMGRTFLVLALSNLCLRDPARQPEYLGIMDRIISDTIQVETERGQLFFLMDYARERPFIASPARSIFVDGEIALMLGARRLIEENTDWKTAFQERVQLIHAQMESSPVLCGESYPNECWMFCNCIALGALRMAEILDGRDFAPFFTRWLEVARTRLVEPKTGMLISSFLHDGTPGDGPEGTSIWLAAHCLRLISPPFAEDQYRRAREKLRLTFFGFDYAQEWPGDCPGGADIDSGPIIPFLNLSAGSTGLAFLGAASFRDEPYLGALLKTLYLGGFPEELPAKVGDIASTTLRFSASNQVGDAVLLYALVGGPLWDKIMAGVRQ